MSKTLLIKDHEYHQHTRRRFTSLLYLQKLLRCSIIPCFILAAVGVCIISLCTFITTSMNSISNNNNNNNEELAAADPQQQQQQQQQQNNIITPSFIWSTIPEKKVGVGVVYCAYSFDVKKSLPIFLKETEVSARQLKENNPTIPIAIITNSDQVDTTIFDYTIHVSDQFLFKADSTREDGIYRQWFSRIYYLAHSPFEITWYVDSHVAFLTTEVERGFNEFNETDIDIATANSNPSAFYCHNFAILYKWNDRVRTLFIDWILRQLDRGIPTDDQRPLCHAMACAGDAYGLKYGKISPQWALAWLSLQVGPKNEYWRYRTTGIIEGKPHMCHKEDVCTFAMNGSPTYDARVLYMNYKEGIEKSGRVFYSQKEIDESGVLPYEYVWKDWDTPQTNIVIPVKYPCPTEETDVTVIKHNKIDNDMNNNNKEKLSSSTFLKDNTQKFLQENFAGGKN